MQDSTFLFINIYLITSHDRFPLAYALIGKRGVPLKRTPTPGGECGQGKQLYPLAALAAINSSIP